MIDQTKLKKIKNSLRSTFSMFLDQQSVRQFVEREMQRYMFPGVYTDSRCKDVFKEAVSTLEEDVNRKYEKIVNTIKEVIEELVDIVYKGTNSDSFSKKNLENVLLGAGLGVYAATLFGGPIGLLAVVGAGIVGIINSSQKKNELIKRINSAAIKLNYEAISKIEELLDRLIIPEPALIEKHQEVIPNAAAIKETLTIEQKKIKEFLEKRNIRYLVHFTSRDNLLSIKKNGILSINECKMQGVDFEINDNDISSHQIEQKHLVTRHDYISLSITAYNSDLVTAYSIKKNIEEFAVLYIDASILWKEINNDRIYCDRNASSSCVKGGRTISDLEGMFVESLSYSSFSGKHYDYNRSRDKTPSNMTTDDHAEIWFYGKINYDDYVQKVEVLEWH